MRFGLTNCKVDEVPCHIKTMTRTLCLEIGTQYRLLGRSGLHGNSREGISVQCDACCMEKGSKQRSILCCACVASTPPTWDLHRSKNSHLLSNVTWQNQWLLMLSTSAVHESYRPVVTIKQALVPHCVAETYDIGDMLSLPVYMRYTKCQDVLHTQSNKLLQPMKHWTRHVPVGLHLALSAGQPHIAARLTRCFDQPLQSAWLCTLALLGMECPTPGLGKSYQGW
jgi:hypothetical protein